MVYWGELEKKYASELSQQQDVFSSEQGAQRQKDFRSINYQANVDTEDLLSLTCYHSNCFAVMACCAPAVLQKRP